MNHYEEKLEAKRERMLDRADKIERQAKSRRKVADDIHNSIPFGQPILVGHHSEKADRNRRERAWNSLGKSIELESKAGELRARAENLGKNGISSDDPEAVKKLKKKLAGLEKSQETMKAANQVIRKKKLSDEEKVAELAPIVGESNAWQLLKPDFAGRIGFASYALQNNNANMRRIKQRIEALSQKPAETKEHEYGDIQVIENAEENRVQIVFPGKPSAEVRKMLKSNGFRWAPSQGAWQRHLNAAGIWHAHDAAKWASEWPNNQRRV